jgi:hypothetical protein
MGTALAERLQTAVALIEHAGAKGGDARVARQAATGLYYVTAAALFVHEAERLADPIRDGAQGAVIAKRR